jgi:hypothetical protein
MIPVEHSTMAGRGILLAAAGLAARQIDAHTAVRAALDLIDRYPAARAELAVAEARHGSGSPWITLTARCKTPAAAARALAAAALANVDNLQVVDVDRSEDTATLLLALAVL